MPLLQVRKYCFKMNRPIWSSARKQITEYEMQSTPGGLGSLMRYTWELMLSKSLVCHFPYFWSWNCGCGTLWHGSLREMCQCDNQWSFLLCLTQLVPVLRSHYVRYQQDISFVKIPQWIQTWSIYYILCHYECFVTNSSGIKKLLKSSDFIYWNIMWCL